MADKVGRIENLSLIQTSEEARERGRAGGIKSGETRRHKKQMRDLARMFLEMRPTDNVASNLSKLGVKESDQTNMMAMLASLYTQAMGGNVAAFRAYMEYAGMTPNQELRDIELEVKMRMIELRAETEAGIGEVSGDDDVMIYLPDNGRGDANGSANQ